jgi:hypothetical protein
VGIYYHADTTRMTLRELWRLSSTWPGFLTGCVNKAFGIRPPVRWAIRHDLTIRALHAEEVPAPTLRVLEPLVEEFEQLGARLAFYQTTPTVGKLEGYSAVLTPPEHNAVIMVVWAKAQISRRGKTSFGCAVTSQLQDGAFFTTTNLPPRFNKPPEFGVLRLRGADPTELARRHQQALAERGSPAILIHDEEKTKSLLRAVKIRNFEWQMARGVYVPLTAEEQARLGLPVTDES